MTRKTARSRDSIATVAIASLALALLPGAADARAANPSGKLTSWSITTSEQALDPNFARLPSATYCASTPVQDFTIRYRVRNIPVAHVRRAGRHPAVRFALNGAAGRRSVDVPLAEATGPFDEFIDPTFWHHRATDTIPPGVYRLKISVLKTGKTLVSKKLTLVADQSC